MALDLATLRERPHRCGECDVEWRSVGVTACWNCDRIDDVELVYPKPYADVSQVDPVAGPPVAP
jgi:hypothetical protein